MMTAHGQPGNEQAGRGESEKAVFVWHKDENGNFVIATSTGKTVKTFEPDAILANRMIDEIDIEAIVKIANIMWS